MLGKIYADAYGLDVMMVRAFNHIGPNQTPMFVVADFCQQAAEIEAGKREAVMRVGNLSAKRDFTDVRDVIRAYALIMEHGTAGETYNVGSGHAVSIQEILDTICLLYTSSSFKIQLGKVKGLKNGTLKTDSVQIKWNKLTGATNYQIYRYDSAKKKYVKLKTVSSGKSSYTDKKREAARAYKYKIRAYRSTGGKTSRCV